MNNFAVMRRCDSNDLARRLCEMNSTFLLLSEAQERYDSFDFQL